MERTALKIKRPCVNISAPSHSDVPDPILLQDVNVGFEGTNLAQSPPAFGRQLPLANGVSPISTYQPTDKRSDLVPSFAGYDQLTLLDLVRFEIQSCRSSIHDYRQSGYAGRSLDGLQHRRGLVPPGRDQRS